MKKTTRQKIQVDEILIYKNSSELVRKAIWHFMVDHSKVADGTIHVKFKMSSEEDFWLRCESRYLGYSGDIEMRKYRLRHIRDVKEKLHKAKVLLRQRCYFERKNTSWFRSLLYRIYTRIEDILFTTPARRVS